MRTIDREAYKLSKKFPDAVISIHTVVLDRGEPLYDDREYVNGVRTGWTHNRAKPVAVSLPTRRDSMLIDYDDYGQDNIDVVG